MTIIILIIIYISFISLGLPDSMTGAAWPVMYGELGVAQGFAGLISMIMSAGTIISSFLSGRLLKMGTGRLTFFSVLLTAAALLCMSFAKSAYVLLILALPLGLGGGAVDAGLNNYVALKYKSRHMNWLHSFWGVGAMAGPMIMSAFLSGGGNWHGGYRMVSFIQFALSALLLASLPLWKRGEKRAESAGVPENDKAAEKLAPRRMLLAKRGVKSVLGAFSLYCALEYTVGYWGSSYLVNIEGVSAADAALWVSFYYGSIMAGRFAAGTVSGSLGDAAMIRIGEITAAAGCVMILLPLPAIFTMIGFILAGLGCAPVYPAMLHSTPRRFGKAESSRLMGVQMGTAYLGGTILPALVGFTASLTSFAVLPAAALLMAGAMLLLSERADKYLPA